MADRAVLNTSVIALSMLAFGACATCSRDTYAYPECDIVCAKFMVEGKKDLNAYRIDGNTLLILAARNGQLDVVELLVENGADVNKPNRDGIQRPLGASFVGGNLAVSDYLIIHGAEFEPNYGGWGALQQASYAGRLDAIEYLLAHGVDPDAFTGKKGLLDAAISSGRLDVVRFWVSKGVDVKGATGRYYLTLAAVNGRLDVGRFLVEQGADVNPGESGTGAPLMAAALNGHLEIARYLLDHGARVNDADKNGWTALSSALRYPQIVELLLSSGAAVNVKHSGVPEILFAAQIGSVKSLELFLRHGADLNARSASGATPLHAAASEGNLAAVQFLLAHGVAVDVRDEGGTTPLMSAAANGKLEVVRLLLDHGAKVNARDEKLRNVLHLASSQGLYETVKLLLSRGADARAQDAEKHAPDILACWNERWGPWSNESPRKNYSCPREEIALLLRGEPPNPAGVDWTTIPGGAFLMGKLEFDQTPPRRVTVPTFQMSRTLVTNKQYKACVTAGACPPAHGEDWSCLLYWEERNLPRAFLGDENPVVCVTHDQAQAFARWAGGRLPSEAEWEYAARGGGEQQKYPWGDAEPTNKQAVFRTGCYYGGGKASTWPVCSKPKGNSSEGLCDMAGNVWEWVEDCYTYNYEGAPTDGSAAAKGPCQDRMARGGSWASYSSDLEVTSREDFTGSGAFSEVGFRIARTVP